MRRSCVGMCKLYWRHHADRQQRPQATNNDTPSIVVLNATEEQPSWQGVDHESGVVIVNEVPEEAALHALEIFESGGQTNSALNDALTYLAENGYGDQYTCGLGFVESKLTPAGRMLSPFTGIVKRDDRDLTPVWHEGWIFYTAPNGEARIIEPDILARTYRNADGSELDLETVPEGRPEGL